MRAGNIGVLCRSSAKGFGGSPSAVENSYRALERLLRHLPWSRPAPCLDLPQGGVPTHWGVKYSLSFNVNEFIANHC